MSDDNKPVRRVNRKERKTRIDVDDSMFAPKFEADFPDLSNVDLPDPDAEAIASLQNLEDAVQPLIVTPQEERYPPLPDTAHQAPKPVTQSRRLPPPRPRHSRRNNFLTFLFVVLTFGVCGYYSLIWVDPQTSLNPLAPLTPFIVITATIDANPAFVASPEPDNGIEATSPAPITDANPFAVAPDGVLYVSNQNGRDCNWASIAGTVTGSDGLPLPGYGIRVTDARTTATVFSGTSTGFGAGGYELTLGSAPIEAEYRVQLFSTAGAPLSAELSVTTRNDCTQNVAIVNFVQR